MLIKPVHFNLEPVRNRLPSHIIPIITHIVTLHQSVKNHVWTGLICLNLIYVCFIAKIFGPKMTTKNGHYGIIDLKVNSLVPKVKIFLSSLTSRCRDS